MVVVVYIFSYIKLHVIAVLWRLYPFTTLFSVYNNIIWHELRIRATDSGTFFL